MTCKQERGLYITSSLYDLRALMRSSMRLSHIYIHTYASVRIHTTGAHNNTHNHLRWKWKNRPQRNDRSLLLSRSLSLTHTHSLARARAFSPCTHTHTCIHVSHNDIHILIFDPLNSGRSGIICLLRSLSRALSLYAYM